MSDLSNAKKIDGALELMKIETQFVRNYEILLTAILIGSVTFSSYLIGSKPIEVEFVLLGAFCIFCIAIKTSIGRSFHYGIYENARDKFAEYSDLMGIINLNKYHYNDRQKWWAIFTFSITTMKNYIFWPVVASSLPIIAFIFLKEPSL